MGVELVKEIPIPAVALGLGASLLPFECSRSAGQLIFYFGAQTGMALYMKTVLSASVVSEEEGLRGLPAAFAVSAIQQLMAFIFFSIGAFASQYTRKKLASWWEWGLVCLFSVSFTANIALNNYSLSLIPLSVNLIIRSCLPLPTFLAQQVASVYINEHVKDGSRLEVVLVTIGVFCAVTVVAARTNCFDGEELNEQILGAVICMISVVSGSINMVLAGVLGMSSELNALDVTFYMSLPAVVLLIVPIFLIRHPVGGWPGQESMTDWEICLKVFALSPTTIALAGLSGIFAFGYNILQFGIVQSFSATHIAFAGNFNKAATIALALLVGLERLPTGTWGFITMAASLGSICTFTVYSLAKVAPQEGEKNSAELGSLLGEPISFSGSGDLSGNSVPTKSLDEDVSQPANLALMWL